MIKTKFYKQIYTTNKFNTNLFTYLPIHLLTLNKLLKNVTKHAQNRQLSFLTCFIIHVGLECIGEKTYA